MNIQNAKTADYTVGEELSGKHKDETCKGDLVEERGRTGKRQNKEHGQENP